VAARDAAPQKIPSERVTPMGNDTSSCRPRICGCDRLRGRISGLFLF
jgi:hypothetical protein